MSRFSKRSLSLRTPLNKNVLHISLLPHKPDTFLPPHSPRFYHLNIIWQIIKSMQIPTMNVPLASCYFLSLKPQYVPQYPVFQCPQPVFFP